MLGGARSSEAPCLGTFNIFKANSSSCDRREREVEITQTSDFTLAVSERCPVSSTTFLLSGMSEGYMKGSVKGSCGTF